MPDGDTYPFPEHGWTCFHCGATFHTIGQAEAHFGKTPEETPVCKLKVELGGERGLIWALRKAESRARRAEGKAEALEYREYIALTGYREIGGAKSPSEARFNWDSMQGRAMAAEAILADIAARWPALVEASRRRICQRHNASPLQTGGDNGPA